MWPFRKKKVPKEIPEIDFDLKDEKEKKKGAEIIFSVVDGKVNVELYWYADKKDEELVAIDFGQLLSDVNSGSYVEEIFEIFNEFIQDNPQETKFVGDTIMVWSESNIDKQKEIERKLKEERRKDGPLIRPLKVFRQSGIFKE